MSQLKLKRRRSILKNQIAAEYRKPAGMRRTRLHLYQCGGLFQGHLLRTAVPLAPSFSRFNSTYVQKHTAVKGEPINAEAAANAPGIQALAARLGLKDIPASSLARTLIDSTSTLRYVNNRGLSKFGKTLISYRVFEHFMAKYPRLPPQVLKHVVETYVGVPALAELGTMWGVQPDSRSSLSRYLSDSSDEQALGRLSFSDNRRVVEDGIVEVSKDGDATDVRNAMGAFVRALVGAIYAHRGLDSAGKFITNYIIAPRKIDITKLMAFSRPTRELAVLCSRENLEPPVSRLIAESGRYSSQAVFVVGVFSGAQKLGEGQGTSLREARTRAAVNALQGWYLYSPSTTSVSDENRAAYIDAGQIVI